MSAWDYGMYEPLAQFIRNLADVPAIQRVYECYSKDAGTLKAFENRLLSNEEFRDLYEHWYVPEKFTVEELLKLPENSFGHCYGSHLKKNNLSPNFITPFASKNILSYLWHRAGHLHDIVHVLTGYDTSVLGEVCVKGFDIAQTGSAPGTCILGSTLVSISIDNPEAIPRMMEGLLDGYMKGKRYPLLISKKWDQEWETPMPELRTKYGLD